jgi:mycothiol synthase
MYSIRSFVPGVDEPVWVEVLNSAYRDREDWRAITAEEFVQEQERPSFDFEGRFIAEIDGKAIGVVHGNVDKLRDDGKGFVRLGVIPEFVSYGVARQLLQTALGELKARGMDSAEAWADSDQGERIQLLEGMGFERVRVFSTMEAELDDIPRDIGENTQVEMRTLRKDLDGDVELFNWLDNESFKEHFNYRPETLEETRHLLLSNPYLKEQDVFFAALNGESVGYIGVGIDDKYNLEKRVRAGEIFTIGVLRGYRRAGVGVRLMLHGLEALRAKGMARAILGVDDDNPTRAIRLYEKVGFRIKTKHLTFQRGLQSVL